MNIKKIWVFETTADLETTHTTVTQAMSRKDIRGSWTYHGSREENGEREFVFAFEQSMFGTLGETGRRSAGAAVGFSVMPTATGSTLFMSIEQAKAYGFMGMGVGGAGVIQSKFKAVRKAMKTLDPNVDISSKR